MTIDCIDGQHLRKAVIAGARRVILMQDNLNKINRESVLLDRGEEVDSYSLLA